MLDKGLGNMNEIEQATAACTKCISDSDNVLIIPFRTQQPKT